MELIVAGETPEMEFKQMPNGKAFVAINKVVDADTAMKIMQAVRDYENNN